MSSTAVRNTILGVIAVAVVAIAAVLIIDRLNQPPEHTGAWQKAHADAEQTARYYCTLGGVVPGMTSLYDPAYKACVKDETASNIAEWERENPDKVWE